MSFAKLELGDYENALNDLKRSEKLFKKNNDKEFFSIFRNESLKKVLKIYELNNDLEKVEEILEILNKNNKENENQLLLGILKFKKGDFYSAISNLLKVYEIDNQNKECIFYLGKAKLALKDYKNALSDFKKFQELDPSDDVVDKLVKTCEKNLSSN